jgi:hypothetical protein
MQLSDLELQEISSFTQAAPRKFPGLLMDETSKGRANAQFIASYLDGRSQQFTVGNLDAAVGALYHTLFWAAGTEPAPIVHARDTKTQKQKAHDGGVKPFEPSQYSDTSESSWAKEIREGREAHAAQNKKRERDDLRYKETHQTVMTANGRISYAQSEALNKAAAQRHAEEDFRESGKPAAVSQPQRIPLHATPQDLKNYDREQIREWMQRRKIAGLPIN